MTKAVDAPKRKKYNRLYLIGITFGIYKATGPSFSGLGLSQKSQKVDAPEK